MARRGLPHTKLEYQDTCDRNEVEGVFGTGKTAYGLGRIPARLEKTSCCVIGVALLLMNLLKRLRFLLFRFFALAARPLASFLAFCLAWNRWVTE